MSTESASQRRGTEFHSQNSCTCNLSYIDMGGGRGGREEEEEKERKKEKERKERREKKRKRKEREEKGRKKLEHDLRQWFSNCRLGPLCRVSKDPLSWIPSIQ